MATGNILLLDRELLKKTGVFALVSSEVVASVVGTFLLGQYLDKKFGTQPWLTAVLAILGFAASIWRIQKVSRSWLQEPGKEK